jgi:intergrase/recombinase
MKKYLIIIAITFGLANFTKAQNPRADKKEKIESLKVAFITEKLDLSVEEAQRFWPVYNKYTAELEKSRKDFRGQMVDELKNLDQMSNAEADKALRDMIEFRSKELDITKQYTNEFKRVIGPQKAVKLFVAEQEFKKELLKMLRQKQQGKG